MSYDARSHVQLLFIVEITLMRNPNIEKLPEDLSMKLLASTTNYDIQLAADEARAIFVTHGADTTEIDLWKSKCF